MVARKGAKSTGMNADVVVIGGGGAGLAAGVAAAEKGAKVTVLEKRGSFGGNSALSLGPFAADSPVQKRKAIEARTEDLFKIAMEWAHWKINPEIVRAFINKSGSTIEWLQEKGLKFDCLPLYPNQTILTWHMTEGFGAQITRTLSREAGKLGVTMLSETPAKKLMIGGNGEIAGVLAESVVGQVEITAKSVIIASGGYGGNKDLLKKYCPEYSENMKGDGIPHTGDGLLMAIEAGAATEGLGLLLLSGPQIPQAVSMNLGIKPDTFVAPLMAVALEPDTLWLNKKGKRFIDEGASYHHFSSSNAVNRQPENLCFTILDQRLVKNKEEHGLVIGLGRPTEEERTKMPGLKREMNKLALKGWIKIGDSWDEIAVWIGAEPETLKNTVKSYNNACESGYDPVFAKDRRYLISLREPPYYAIKGNSDFLDTIGGIKINEKMEVLDRKHDPIPGLYAAGVVAGGWQADTYCDVLSGAASGFAYNSGRIAAENAVKYTKVNA